MRDRAIDLIAEEDDLARTLGVDVGPRPRPTVPAPPRRPRHAAHAVRRVLVDRLHARIARHAARRGVRLGAGRRRRHGPHRPPGRTDRSGLPRRRRRRRGRFGGAPARAAARQRPRLPRAVVGIRTPDHPTARMPTQGRRIDRRGAAPPRLHPAEREGVDRRRERPHRPATRPPHRPAAQAQRQRQHVRGPEGGQLRRPPPARRRQVRGHGQARHRRRRTRLPADLVQGRRQALRAERPDRHAAPVRRRRGAVAAPPRRIGLRQDEEPRPLGRARDRPGTRRALPEAGQRAGPLVRPGHAVAGRDGRGVPVRGDAGPAHGDRRHQARHGTRRIPWIV